MAPIKHFYMTVFSTYYNHTPQGAPALMTDSRALAPAGLTILE